MDINSQKNINIFFILDISGSMQGERIQSLNNAIRLCLEKAKEITKANTIGINFAILTFNNECKWETNNILCNVNNIVFEELCASNLTYFGQAVDELNRILTRSLFEAGMNKNKQVFVFVSDGNSNDEWNEPLDRLKTNPWFKYGHKVAYGLGNDADMEMLNALFSDRFERCGQSFQISDYHLNEFKDGLLKIIHLVPQMI